MRKGFFGTGFLSRDGEPLNYNLGIGESTTTSIHQEKIKYLNHLEGCRAKPFNEILLARIAEDSFEDCPHKCRPDLSFGKNLNKIIESMPICKNRTLHYCFERVRRKISKDILDKPCPKVQVWPLANFFLSPFGKKII